MAGNKAAGHTQGAKAQLLCTGLVGVIAYQIFTKVLHVMDVQAHVVAKAVRLEQACYAEGHHFV